MVILLTFDATDELFPLIDESEFVTLVITLAAATLFCFCIHLLKQNKQD